MKISSSHYQAELLRKYTEERALYLKKLQETERVEDQENKRIIEKAQHIQRVNKDKGGNIDIYV